MQFTAKWIKWAHHSQWLDSAWKPLAVWGRHGICTLAYTRKNAWSVTAFNSTDIRSVQDNVVTPVTAMMVTVCISTDALSSVFISPDLSDTNSYDIIPVSGLKVQQAVTGLWRVCVCSPYAWCHTAYVTIPYPIKLFSLYHTQWN